MTARFNQITERLNDDIIGDIIPVRISADMSVAALHALETIFYLRLQLAQAAWEDNEPLYEELCHDRLTQIAAALRKKYKTLTSPQPIESGKPLAESGRPDFLTERIEILERLSSIGQLLQTEDYYFAIEEADKLLRHPCRSSESGTNLLPSLLTSSSILNTSYLREAPVRSAALRLSWIPNIITENESQIVSALLSPSPEGRAGEGLSVFDMATLDILSDFVTPRERDAIFNRFTSLLETAIRQLTTPTTSTTPTTPTTTPLQGGLGALLTLAAHWNSDPHLRKKISTLTSSPLLHTSFSILPTCVARLNPIAAEIYSRLDKITGKYDILSA